MEPPTPPTPLSAAHIRSGACLAFLGSLRALLDSGGCECVAHAQGLARRPGRCGGGGRGERRDDSGGDNGDDSGGGDNGDGGGGDRGDDSGERSEEGGGADDEEEERRGSSRGGGRQGSRDGAWATGLLGSWAARWAPRRCRLRGRRAVAGRRLEAFNAKSQSSS